MNTPSMRRKEIAAGGPTPVTTLVEELGVLEEQRAGAIASFERSA